MTDGPAPFTDEDLVAYADGRLDAARAGAVTAWLEANPEQRKRIEAWRAATAMLAEALAPVAAEPVPPALLAALQPLPVRSRFAAPAAAAAAGLVAGLALGWSFWADTSPAAQEIADLGLSAHQVYIAEVRHPVEVWEAEETHLVAWLSKRIDAPVKPPDLSAAGLKLLGGRVVPEDGRPAALLMYEGADGERFTLLITRQTQPSTTALRWAEKPGAGAFYWLDGTVGYVLSGPDDRERLLSLSRQVYEQLS